MDINKPLHESDSSVERPSRPAIECVMAGRSRWTASSSSLQATGRFLRQQVWLRPIIAAVLVAILGWWVLRSVDNAMRKQRTTDLNTLVNASVTSVQTWMGEQQINVNLIADDEQLRPLVAELLRLADGTAEVQRHLLQAQAQTSIRKRLTPRSCLASYVGYHIMAPSGIILAADQDAAVGQMLTGDRKQAVDRVMTDQNVVSRPYRTPYLLPDEKGELRANQPCMFTAGPLRDDKGKPIAVLGLRIRPEHVFTRILQVATYGRSGETYAFDRNGLLLTQSRFDDELKALGLLADQSDAHSILTVEVRDPQVNMHLGERPTLRRSEQPLTYLARAAVEGTNGCNADSYRDYRGVPSVGAWRWLPEYDFAIATEIDVDEAFQPVYALRRAFWILMGLLVLVAAGMFLTMHILANKEKALQKANLAARQLGQYALEKKLGAGGMGTVYRARHAMLRRPTAVKLLDADKMSPEAVGRFEREVQLTSTLTHPNTVAVFDYGRTPDNIFYYAMEYLEGLNLDDLVARCGPLPEARVVFILRQVCGALAEAHAAGLVHRDIKPANIFLTNRGGLYDFVKVLDFGLVKPLAGQENANLTSPNALMGTPLYLSPEAVSQPETVDARADVYAIGAVAYYLLTGAPVFTGATLVEICLKHVEQAPVPPSQRLGRPISPDLEALVLRCLAKAPSDRPRDARDLLIQLDHCFVEGSWTASEAATWWANFSKSAPPTELAATVSVEAAGHRETAGPETTVTQF